VRRLARIVGLALVVATPAPAGAQQRLPLELDWHAPADCPSSAGVRAQLERIARVRTGFTLTPLTARAEVVREGAGYALRLHTERDGQHGERRLEATDCETLVSSVTLVLALAFGAGVEVSDTAAAPEQNAAAGASGAEDPPPAPLPSREQGEPAQATRSDIDATESRSSAAPTADAAPDDGLRAPRRPKVVLLLGGGVQLAVLPSAALAVSAGIELGLGVLSVGMRATGWPAVSDGVTAQLSARFDGIGAALAGCGHAPLHVLSLGLCAGARAAALRGRSSGALENGSDTAPWYALASAVSLTWPREHALRVRVEAGLALSLARARFEIEGPGAVHRVPLLAPELGVLVLITP
jgi:hypothetical protein